MHVFGAWNCKGNENAEPANDNILVEDKKKMWKKRAKYGRKRIGIGF